MGGHAVQAEEPEVPDQVPAGQMLHTERPLPLA